MGSKATADEELMRRVLGILAERGLFFVDSRTTARTVAERVAGEMGVPAASRDIFLDPVEPGSGIAAAFASGIERAAANGSALLIGHVQNREVLAILRASAPALREAGVEIVPLSQVLQARRGGTGR
jgi:hypothetical protein